jgi:hypothetical protein
MRGFLAGEISLPDDFDRLAKRTSATEQSGKWERAPSLTRRRNASRAVRLDMIATGTDVVRIEVLAA